MTNARCRHCGDRLSGHGGFARCTGGPTPWQTQYEPVEAAVSIRCRFCGMDVKDPEHPVGVCERYAASVIAQGPPKKPTLRLVR